MYYNKNDILRGSEDFMDYKEQTLNSEEIFKGNVIKVYKDTVKLHDGKSANRELVMHNGGCCAVAVDDDYNILIVKQFRYPYKEMVEEIPAGKLDKIGESPLDAAKRELLEETGHEAKVWQSLGTIYPTPGYCNEVLYIYLALDLKQVSSQNLDDGEFLSYYKVPFKEAFNNAINGVYKDAKTVVGIFKAYYKLKLG